MIVKFGIDDQWIIITDRAYERLSEDHDSSISLIRAAKKELPLLWWNRRKGIFTYRRCPWLWVLVKYEGKWVAVIDDLQLYSTLRRGKFSPFPSML